MSSNEPTLPFDRPPSEGNERTLPAGPERISQLGLETALSIDRLCADFEQACRRDANCRLESWLVKCSERERMPAFEELLAIEADERAKHGHQVHPAEYRRRFPEYSAIIDRWARTHEKSAETIDLAGLPSTLPLTASASSEVQERFGDFEVLGEIGSDGPWLLRRARQTQLNRQVILKSPRPAASPAEIETLVAALHQEAEIAAKLDHPGILPVVGSGEWEGIPYLALGSVDGETLAAALHRGPLDNRLAADYARQLSETLFTVHQAGIRHGNLRPEDVYIGRDGRLRLTGFQAADIMPQRVTSYTAPERRPGFSANIDHRIDVYGIGCLLYLMLTGKPPYQAANESGLWALIWKGKLQPPRELNRRIDRDLDAICRRCLAAEPYERYRGRLPTQPLIGDLRRYLSGRTVEARPDAAWRAPLLWARRNRRPFIAAAAAVMVLLFAIGWEHWQKHQAWERLLKDDVSPVAAEQSRDFFARRIQLRPHLAEYSVGKSLATLRARGPVAALRDSSPSKQQPNYQFGYMSDTNWNQTLLKVQRQIALRLGYFSVATEHLASSERSVSRRVDEVLSDENLRYMKDGDVLALSVSRGDPGAIRAAATVKPTEDLIQALVEEAATQRDLPVPQVVTNRRVDDYLSEGVYGRYYHAQTREVAREALAKLELQLTASPGAQRAIPNLILLFANGDPVHRPSIEQLLNSIDPRWRESSQARTAIAPLIVSRGTITNTGSEDPVARAKFLDELLNGIEPQWMNAMEAEAAVAPLSRHLEKEVSNHAVMVYHAAQATRQRYEPLWSCIGILKLLRAHAAEAKPTLESMLGKGDLAKMAGAAGLASVDPSWTKTAAAKQTLTELIESQGQSFGAADKPTDGRSTVDATKSTEARYPTDFALAMEALVEVDRPASVEALLYTLPNEAAIAALGNLESDWTKSPTVVGSVPHLCQLLQQEVEPARIANMCWILGKLGTEASPAQVELIKRLPIGEQVVISATVSQLLRGQSYESNISVGEAAYRSLDLINPSWRTDPANRAVLAATIDQMLRQITSNERGVASSHAAILALVGQQPLSLEHDSKAFDEVMAGLDSPDDQVRMTAYSLAGALGWRSAPAIPVLIKRSSEATHRTPIARSTLQNVLLSARQSGFTLDEMRAEVGQALDLAQLLPLLTLPRCEARQEAVALLTHLNSDWRKSQDTISACRTWKQDLTLEFLSSKWNTAATALYLCGVLPPETEQALLSGFAGSGEAGDLSDSVRAGRLLSAQQIGEMQLSSPPVVKALLDAIGSDRTESYDNYLALTAMDSLAAIGAAALPATLQRIATPIEALRNKYFRAAIREVPNLSTDDVTRKQVEQWCRELTDQPLESPALYGLQTLANLPTYSIPPQAVVPALTRCLEDGGRWRAAVALLANYGPEAADALPAILVRALKTDSARHDDETLLWGTIEKIDPWAPCTPQVAKAWGEQPDAAEAILLQCKEAIPPPPSAVSRALDRLAGAKELDPAEQASTKRAIRALGHLRTEGGPAIPLLSKCLLFGGDSRHHSACSLGRLGSVAKAAVPNLIESMISADSQDYTRVSLECLGLIDPDWTTVAEYADARRRLGDHCARSLRTENTKWHDHFTFAALGHFAHDRLIAEQGGGEFIPVDLSTLANEDFSARIGDGDNHLDQVPRGSYGVNGSQFIISDKYVRLTSLSEKDGEKSTRPIPVQANGGRLHFLQATWGSTDGGLVVGFYRIQFTDGSRDLIPLVFGQNIGDWWVNKTQPRPPLPFGKVAWRGTNPQVEQSGSVLELTHYTWVNPYPEKTIASLQVVNIPGSRSGCCLVALSLEQLAR